MKPSKKDQVQSELHEMKGEAKEKAGPITNRRECMHLFSRVAFLGAVLMTSLATVPTVLKAADDQPKRYHDKEHKDDHEWNDREDRAYQKWLEEKHHVKREFAKLKGKEQNEYWKWRHEHPDRDDSNSERR